MNGVLLSGGWESVGCLLKSIKEEKTIAFFYDYGQPYVDQELTAVKKLNKKLDFDLIVKKIDVIVPVDGVFLNRNSILLEHAAFYEVDCLYFGCRGLLNYFDKYKDSNWQYAQQKSKELKIQIKTPFILHPKFVIKNFVRSSGINDQDIFSSEGFNYDLK